MEKDIADNKADIVSIKADIVNIKDNIEVMKEDIEIIREDTAINRVATNAGGEKLDELERLLKDLDVSLKRLLRSVSRHK